MVNEDEVVRQIQCEFAENRNIAVLGWRTKRHDEMTRNLENGKRVRFFENVPKILPQNVNVYLTTTTPTNIYRSRLRHEGVRPVVLTEHSIKRVLARAQGAIKAIPKPSATVIETKQPVTAPPASRPLPAEIKPPQTPSEEETMCAVSEAVTQVEPALIDPSDNEDYGTESSQPDPNAVAFSVELCAMAEEWAEYLIPRGDVAQLLRKHFGEKATAQLYKKYLKGLAQAGKTNVSMYTPSKFARAMADHAISLPEPELEAVPNEDAFLATQPAPGAERAQWLIDNRATLVKFQKYHEGRAQFFAEQFEKAKKAEKVLKALENF